MDSHIIYPIHSVIKKHRVAISSIGLDGCEFDDFLSFKKKAYDDRMHLQNKILLKLSELGIGYTDIRVRQECNCFTLLLGDGSAALIFRRYTEFYDTIEANYPVAHTSRCTESEWSSHVCL